MYIFEMMLNYPITTCIISILVAIMLEIMYIHDINLRIKNAENEIEKMQK